MLGFEYAEVIGMIRCGRVKRPAAHARWLGSQRRRAALPLRVLPLYEAGRSRSMS